MDLVEDDDVVVGQHRIGGDLPQQQALRDEDDARVLRLGLLEADLVAHYKKKRLKLR